MAPASPSLAQASEVPSFQQRSGLAGDARFCARARAIFARRSLRAILARGLRAHSHPRGAPALAHSLRTHPQHQPQPVPGRHATGRATGRATLLPLGSPRGPRPLPQAGSPSWAPWPPTPGPRPGPRPPSPGPPVTSCPRPEVACPLPLAPEARDGRRPLAPGRALCPRPAELPQARALCPRPAAAATPCQACHLVGAACLLPPALRLGHALQQQRREHPGAACPR